MYVHTTSHTLPNYDMSLGSLALTIPDAGDFMQSLEPYLSRI